nr:hypothetical protein HK105_007129 [Polyrhizophydium stewartii]
MNILTHAVQQFGATEKWDQIATLLPKRTPEECQLRWNTHTQPRKGKWTEEEDRKLLSAYNAAIIRTPTPNAGFWNKIAESITGRSGPQCMARYNETLDPSVVKGKWSAHEDVLLRKGCAEFGKVWVRIAEMIPGRTQRQCRTRWMMLRRYDSNKRSAERAAASQANASAAVAGSAEDGIGDAFDGGYDAGDLDDGAPGSSSMQDMDVCSDEPAKSGRSRRKRDSSRSGARAPRASGSSSSVPVQGASVSLPHSPVGSGDLDEDEDMDEDFDEEIDKDEQNSDGEPHA